MIVTGDTTGTSSGRMALLYKNQNGAFIVVETGIIGVEAGSVDWGDYDNDGDLDLLVTGLKDATQGITKVYRNDLGTFLDIGAPLTGVYSGGNWAT